MINKKVLATVCISICLVTIVYGSEIPTLKELQETTSLKIEGTKIAKVNDAIKIADKAYFRKVGGIMANEAAGSPSIITLGYEVAGFGKVGDKVWEVRISVMTADSTRALRAILWINPRTEKVHFVCGPWEDKLIKNASQPTPNQTVAGVQQIQGSGKTNDLGTTGKDRKP